MKKAFVIIPTYNERENIQKVIPLLLDVFKKVPNWNLGIVVVDDSSPDKTYEVVANLAKKHKNVHLVLNKQKAGLGGAYLKGMDEAFHKLDADVVFEFDADLSHDPTKIPDFLKKIDEGYEMVLGSRYIAGGGIPENWGAHRKFLSVFGNIFIMTVLTDFRIRDWTGGYRAITKPVYEAVYPELLSERFSGYTFQIGFLHKAVKKGFKITEVPFKFVDREIGQSKLGMEYIKNTLLYITKVRMKEILNNRIFKFVMVGGIGALIQLTTLQLWWMFLPYIAAALLSIECAILSNFALNNMWTFADRKLKTNEIPEKLAKFHLASLGSVGIQYVIAQAGFLLLDVKHVLFVTPIVPFGVKVGLILSAVGILVGMFWNFFAYNAFIWKKKSKNK